VLTIAVSRSLPNSVLTFKKTPEQALQEVQQHMERQFAEVLGW